MSFGILVSARLRQRGTLLALIGLVAAGCSGQGQDLVVPAAQEPALAVIEQPADLFEAPLGNVTPPWGSATIRRSPTGVQVQLKVTDPILHAALAGNAITIWMASFNDPEACETEGDICGFGDLFIPAVGGAIQRAGGQVLGSGPITLTFNVREGEAKEKLAGDAVGLLDAQNDEIHVIVLSHGAPIPGLVDDQIHTVDGACNINTCVDAAVVVFR
ncbi:MAG: hypothetical protein U0974_13785 [Gemmatimonadales bacterium]|nr:hypothetical protein [Gemmatimonadales bacterium]MDZ4390785.1 hypothetical protein [Gemmatimonadales bacterium]